MSGLALQKPNICVLMSTYNGEKYIREQIDSILAQKGVEVHLIVRDDGSVDGTLQILREYEQEGKLELWCGQNLGVKESFLYLIDNAPDADFFALADQDDVWYEDKLLKAINMLREYSREVPLLYGANQDCVDANLKFVKLHFKKNLSDWLCIEREIFQNLIAGCTMVFNKSFYNLLKMDSIFKPISYSRMHDVWLMFMALLYGKFIYDHRPCMAYRRHGNNASDGAIVPEHRILFWTINFFRMITHKIENGHYASYSAKLVLDNAADKLTDLQKKQLKIIADYRKTYLNKIKLMFSFDILAFAKDPLPVCMLKVLFERY